MERLGRSVDSDVCAPKPLGKLVPRHRAALRQRDEKHPGENIDQYALRISSLFTRLLTEAARTTPMGKWEDPQLYQRRSTHLATEATSSKHQLQHVCHAETKYD